MSTTIWITEEPFTETEEEAETQVGAPPDEPGGLPETGTGFDEEPDDESDLDD